MALSAVAIVAIEALLGAAGASTPLLSVAALALAPGLALAPLLPARVRESPVAVVAACPALGFAAAAVALITVASLGASLDGASVADVAPGAGIVLLWACFTLTVGLAAFRAAVARERRAGTIGLY